MKRMLAVLGLLASVMSISVASGTSATEDWNLTLAPVTQTVVTDGMNEVWTEFTAVLTDTSGQAVTDEDVYGFAFKNDSCSGDPEWSIDFTAGDGSYTGSDWFDETYLGTWSYVAIADLGEEYAASNCVIVNVIKPGAAVVQENGVFLCYSAYQDQPGVWPASEAKALLEKGYWYPYAVSGKVDGGTNVGDYHLTCNIAATQSVSKTSFVGGDGTVLGSAYAGVLGVYPMIGG